MSDGDEVPRVTRFVYDPHVQVGSPCWFACAEPERPTDPHVVWHYGATGEGCIGCQVKADALARAHPDDLHAAWLVSIVGTP